ncbi:hypothetical protein T06_15633 [Trichinella sp. T6]|nr:hypothetical protein T06_10212 [Trichinella sp. T6]KRX51993.1 hypothetical protein T06_15633 [Trichinella sp. T6]
MQLVPLATLVHMDIKAFPSRPSVPLLITNSIVYHCGFCRFMKPVPMPTRRFNGIFYPSQFTADATQIAFPTVLMFFLVTQVHNCED